MNRKNIPLVMMLVTGAVVSVITYIRNCTVQEKLAALLITLVIFWILGSILEGTLNRFDAQNEERRKQEGEVIEKEAENAEGGADPGAGKDEAAQNEQ